MELNLFDILQVKIRNEFSTQNYKLTQKIAENIKDSMDFESLLYGKNGIIYKISSDISGFKGEIKGVENEKFEGILSFLNFTQWDTLEQVEIIISENYSSLNNWCLEKTNKDEKLAKKLFQDNFNEFRKNMPKYYSDLLITTTKELVKDKRLTSNDLSDLFKYL